MKKFLLGTLGLVALGGKAVKRCSEVEITHCPFQGIEVGVRKDAFEALARVSLSET